MRTYGFQFVVWVSNENPYYVDAYIKLAYLAFKRGSVIKSLETLEKAIKIIELNKLRPDLVNINLIFNFKAICLKSHLLLQS